jgi:hypothetical protein
MKEEIIHLHIKTVVLSSVIIEIKTKLLNKMIADNTVNLNNSNLARLKGNNLNSNPGRLKDNNHNNPVRLNVNNNNHHMKVEAEEIVIMEETMEMAKAMAGEDNYSYSIYKMKDPSGSFVILKTRLQKNLNKYQ